MKEYRISIGGIEHTVELDEDDAKRLGAKAVETKAAPAPQNKARAADKKG